MMNTVPVTASIPPAPPRDTGWSARAIAFLATALIVAFALVLVLLYLGTSRAKTPKGPIVGGFEAGLRDELKEGPVQIADLDPDGRGEKSFFFDLEDGRIVAIKVAMPGRKDCNVRYKANRGYIACDGKTVDRDDLARFPVSISKNKNNEGTVYVDIHRTLPPPNDPDPAVSTSVPSGSTTTP